MGEKKGYQPEDVVEELRSDLPRSALFTTFTFSPGAFQQQYASPLIQHGCGDIAVLADRMGYAQSLFAAAAVQGIGTDYRLRQVSVPGAFHGKLVLIRTGSSMIVGVGSGNLTASGLQTNAEVGALYVIKSKEQLGQLDNLVIRLRHLAKLDNVVGEQVSPIALDENSRLLTSLDSALIDQMNLPDDVRRIEIVSPFVDGKLEVLQTMRELWPDAAICLRLDPGFGALAESVLEIDDDRVEVQVPIEPKNDKDGERRPAVHGKLICFVRDDDATAILGSANLSRPAFLARENFEAVIERRISTESVRKLLSVPHVRWRKAKSSDRRSFSFIDSAPSFSPLIATLTMRHLQLDWSAESSTSGVAKLWCRGRCVFEHQLSSITENDGRHSWSCEIESEVKSELVTSCFAEVELGNGRRFRGWVDVTDLLGVAPEAKGQLVLLDAIASDPLECKEKDVVKFIELLQRNLKSAGRVHAFSASQASKKVKEEYEDTPIQRSLLLEAGGVGGIGQSVLLNQLINRSLSTALRDLRFFGRDNVGQGSTGKKARKSFTTDGKGLGQDDSPLPPKIQSVLGKLFGQLAEALDATGSIRETVELIGQIPTCLKALAYAVERWIPRSQKNRVLYHHFHKVAVACLAPGISSILHRNGVVCRFNSEERLQIRGGADFDLGVAMLEAYLLLQFQSASEETRPVLKDMHNVLTELPAPQLNEVNEAGAELVMLEHGEVASRPDLEQVRSQLCQTTGELVGLRDCREALRQLVDLVNSGVRTDSELMPLAEQATGGGDPRVLLDVIQSSGSRMRLVEVEHDETACPECYTTFPVSVGSLLNNTKRVWRCGCGVLLARSIDQ